jgi:translocation and assembly module TamB
VSNVTAGVQVAGTLRHPELTLFSQPSMNQADILSYLLLGKPTSQAGSTEGKMLSQAAGSLGLTGGELLAQRIGQAFGIEEVGIVSGSGTEGPSLMLGTYLSPRMYVSYGIGLFSPVNTLRLRYDLSKRWQIQTQTGTATSADVLYTIER